MRTTGKKLMRIAGGLFAVALIVSMVLGYSGNARLAGIANNLLFSALVLTIPLLIAGFIVYMIGRAQPDSERPGVAPQLTATALPTRDPLQPATPNSLVLNHKLAELEALRQSSSISEAEHQLLRQRALDAYARGLDT